MNRFFSVRGELEGYLDCGLLRHRLAYDSKLLGKVTRAFLTAVLAFYKKRLRRERVRRGRAAHVERLEDQSAPPKMVEASAADRLAERCAWRDDGTRAMRLSHQTTTTATNRACFTYALDDG